MAAERDQVSGRPGRHGAALWRAFLLVLCIQLPIVLAGYGLYTRIGGHDLIGAEGLRAGGDYPVYYLASNMALGGEAALAYDPAALSARSFAVLGFVSDDLPWFYPPTFLFFLAPFALLPPAWSLGAWVFFNAAVIAALGYALAGRGLGVAKRCWFALAALAFPSALLSLFAGQNGGLSAGLLGGGLLLLERRPLLAGALLGLATFKPQLGILVPVALVAGGCWRAIGAACVTFLGFAGASAAVFGSAPWLNHLDALGRARAMIEDGVMPIAKMVTPLSSFYLMALPAPLPAILMWAFVGFSVVLVFVVWRRSKSWPLRISVLIAATFLAAPYAYFHDAAILALPLLMWARAAQRSGWRAGEPLLLASFWLAPYAMWALAVFAGWHLWPLLLLALLAALGWRFGGPRAQPAKP
jgi:hypothetical protein